MVRKFTGLGALVLTIVAGLAAAQGIPNLSGYDRETRQSMELACISEKGEWAGRLRCVPEQADRIADRARRASLAWAVTTARRGNRWSLLAFRRR